MTSFAMPPAAARAVLELRVLVEGKGLAFTPPSVGRRWQQGRKLAVCGHCRPGWSGGGRRAGVYL
jgi:hypothetical protein